MKRPRFEASGLFTLLAAALILGAVASAAIPFPSPAGAAAKGKLVLAWHAGFASRWLDPQEHDAGTKTVFRHAGRYAWRDACRLCLSNPKHASFFVQKLWGYFNPVAPDAQTERALEAAYRQGHRHRKRCHQHQVSGEDSYCQVDAGHRLEPPTFEDGRARQGPPRRRRLAGR